MQRAAAAALKRGVTGVGVRGPGRPGKATATRRQNCGLCALTGTSQRHIFTGSAVLKKDEELKHIVAPAQQKDADNKEAASPGKNDLLNLIGGMKVEVSTMKRFQALRMQRPKDQANVQPENMESATSMFQKATEDIKSQCNIIANMKIGKRPGVRVGSRPANQIRFDEDGQGYVPDRGVTSEFNAMRKRRGLFTGKRLNIFPAHTDESETVPETVSLPSLWDTELANQIATATEQLPRNGFEEMIQWTKEGKLRQFPVNNEAGLEGEEGVEFHEHIFLEKHLHGFPEQGPIRHFIELVINGLCKNPYLTVQQKIEHIDWFRQYFHEKEDILKESEVYIN
uniref:small ribosomal subunit protein mS31 isoform X2 n=1 Tax=Pristiophorus japonicus TaxID=55135 RepID=UPI00398EBED1